MAKEVSTGIRAFVKDSLNQYYKRFQIKLDNNPSKNSNKSAIKINNDGSIYVYDIGNYTGSVFDNASTLQEVIKAIGQEHGTLVEAGNNIQVDSTETTSTISALGYTYNQEKNSFAELNSNIASGSYSHAEGYNTKTTNFAEHSEGKYNQSHEGKTIHSIGIGSSESTRKNAFEIMQDGSIYVYGLSNYDGSTLLNASTLQDVCNSKADKIINASEGHFASLDANGNLQDSGKKPADFALVDHSHSAIFDTDTQSNIAIYEGSINIVVEEESGPGGEVEINPGNIGNLYRALQDPDVPAIDGNKLITNGQVFDAIDKINSINQIDINDEQEAHLSAIAEDDDVYFVFVLKDGDTEKRAMITLLEMDNFNRALTTPSSIPEDDDTKLITSKAVFDAVNAPREDIRNGGSRVRCKYNEDVGKSSIKFYVQDDDSLEEFEAEINTDNIDNLKRALNTPSSVPEDVSTKLITSKAVFDALTQKVGVYNDTLRVDSAGNNSYPIPEGGNVQIALDSFVDSTEKDKMYNVLVQFVILAAGFAHYCPAIVYWTINSNAETLVHIYVGDYRFMATKAEGATAWNNVGFSKSSFLETF